MALFGLPGKKIASHQIGEGGPGVHAWVCSSSNDWGRELKKPLCLLKCPKIVRGSLSLPFSATSVGSILCAVRAWNIFKEEKITL